MSSVDYGEEQAPPRVQVQSQNGMTESCSRKPSFTNETCSFALLSPQLPLTLCLGEGFTTSRIPRPRSGEAAPCASSRNRRWFLSYSEP